MGNNGNKGNGKKPANRITGNRVGRPSKPFLPEYCEKLIQHMAQGYSFESFSAEIHTCKETLYTWAKKYPEFLDAKKRATEKCRKFWEHLGILGTAGKLKGFNSVGWLFNMKNRFGWRDKQDITTGGEKLPAGHVYYPDNQREPVK